MDFLPGVTMAKFKHKGFEDIPTDSDTRVWTSKLVEAGGFDAVHELWSWEGIVAESLIFRESDLDGLDDKALEDIVKNSSYCEPASLFTTSRDRSGYALVNFNFVV